MSHANDQLSRFSNLELDDGPRLSSLPLVPMPQEASDGIEVEWDDAPATTPGATTIESVEDLYKGRFQGHKSLADVLSAIPELGATVEKVPLFTGDGAQMPGAYGTIRRVGDSVQGLGVVGERYRVIQDSEAFKIMEPLIDRGLVGTLTAGVYKAKSWLYGEAGEFKADIVPGDTIAARVLIGNSHDGSIPWSFGYPGNRVVCQNTFHMALSSKLSKLLRVRHTAAADAIIQQVIQATEAFGMEFVENVDKMKMMASIKVDDDQLRSYTGYVFSKWADTSDDDEVSERGGERIYAKVLENFQAGQGAEFHRGSAWGAFNAVTEYLTHQRGRGTDEQTFQDLQWGNGAIIAKRAWERALELA
jgi:phage/plasmid-like protein (TIGR03299 family)